ncbi:MAG TPA: hypothetical protein VMG08_09640 [Allosphingosinicella sp.]|nr:hypothetical protein [Allosphingosinicella sp.]
MKSFLFAAALLTSTAAIAQTDPMTTTPAEPTAAAEPATQPAEPAMTTTAAAEPMAASPTGQQVAPGNTAPERDARGIAVISDAATAPPGFNNAPGMNGMGGPVADASQPPAQQPADPSYQACSRTVTDNCVQTYERRSRR